MATIKSHNSPKKLSVFSFLKYEHLVAGISGGVTSTLILHPLDLIKIRFAGECCSTLLCLSHSDQWKPPDKRLTRGPNKIRQTQTAIIVFFVQIPCILKQSKHIQVTFVTTTKQKQPRDYTRMLENNEILIIENSSRPIALWISMTSLPILSTNTRLCC